MIPNEDKLNTQPDHTKATDHAVNAINAKNENNLFAKYVPLSQYGSNLPSFPSDCLPSVIGQYCKAVSAHSETPPDMAAVIGLGVLAVALQGKYEVEDNPGHTEQLSLYTVVSLEPGERKSSVLQDMTRPIYEYEQQRNEELEPKIRENDFLRHSLERRIASYERSLEKKYDPQIEKKLEELQTQLTNTPVIEQVRFTTDDCSSEKLENLLSRYGHRFSVISAEGGIFDIMAGRYSGNANFQVWLKGHCGDRIVVDRLGRETVHIDHPALSAILTIQPIVLADIMTNHRMAGRGLLARLLYASPLSRIGSRDFNTDPIPREISEEYKKLIFRLMDTPMANTPVILKLSEPARNMISAYFTQHELYLIGEGQEIADWASKYIGTVLRIAGLIHVASSEAIVTGEDEISESTMGNAILIGKYFLAHARYAYSLMGTDTSIRKAKFVFSKLCNCGRKDLKRSELFQMCRGKFFKKTEEIFPIIDILKDHGYVRLEQPSQSGTAGRPGDVHVIINPDAIPKNNSK